MRNLLMLTIALGLATAASAQNTADVSHSGSNTHVEVNQTGSNAVLVDQMSVYGQDVEAYVTQFGNNSASVIQDHNRQGIRDAGSLTATINQYSGSGSEAFIEQGPASGGYLDANSYIGNLSATINQTGDSHFATQSQRRRNNTATINQTGFDNDARQGQDREILDEEPGSDHVATITQDGSSSFAVQTQNGHEHTATITQQVGSEANRAEQDQSSSLDLAGGGLVATIDQSGSDSEAYQLQGGLGHEATITQSGEYNVATQDQDGIGHTATATQSGAGTAADLNTVGQVQSGLDQESDVTQLGGEGNMALTTQGGLGHSSIVSQDGSFHNAAAMQSGLGHTATVTQN